MLNTYFKTENPQVYVYQYNMLTYRCDDNCAAGGSPDVYGHIYSNVFTGNIDTKIYGWENEISKSGVKYGTMQSLPCGYYQRHREEGSSPRTNVLQSDYMKDQGYVMMGYHTADQGGGDAPSKIGDATKEVGTKVANTWMKNAIGSSKDFVNILGITSGGVIGSALVSGIASEMLVGCDDETIFKGQLVGQETNNWDPFDNRVLLLYGCEQWTGQDMNINAAYPGSYRCVTHSKGIIRFFWILGDF